MTVRDREMDRAIKARARQNECADMMAATAVRCVRKSAYLPMLPSDCCCVQTELMALRAGHEGEIQKAATRKAERLRALATDRELESARLQTRLVTAKQVCIRSISVSESSTRCVVQAVTVWNFKTEVRRTGSAQGALAS